MSIIYKITNPKGQIYIGSTSRPLYTRKAEHKYQSKKGKVGFLYDSIREYGFENHTFDVVCEVRKDDRHELEHFIIEEFNTELNQVERHNATATGRIWVNDGEKEFQIYPENLTNYKNVERGRIREGLGRKPNKNNRKYVM